MRRPDLGRMTLRKRNGPLGTPSTRARVSIDTHQVTHAAAIVQHGGTLHAKWGRRWNRQSGPLRAPTVWAWIAPVLEGSALVDSELAALPTRQCRLPSPSGSPFRDLPTGIVLG